MLAVSLSVAEAETIFTTDADVGKAKFSNISLPKDLDVVKAGGYDTLSKLAADPKAELVTLIVNNLRNKKGNGNYQDEGKIDALVALLQSEGKGFSSVAVDGEWNEVLARQGKKSTISQKLVGKKQKKNQSGDHKHHLIFHSYNHLTSHLGFFYTLEREYSQGNSDILKKELPHKSVIKKDFDRDTIHHFLI